MGEILLIAVVALLAVGPDRLPQAARSIGRGIRDLRRQTTDLQQALEQDSHIGDAVRELRSAWYGTTGNLPKNRYELGRALDQVTQTPTQPAAGERPGRAELPSAATADGKAAPNAADSVDSAPPESPAEPAPEPATADDDGLPPIKPPSGTIARGAAAGAESDDAPVDSPKPAHG